MWYILLKKRGLLLYIFFLDVFVVVSVLCLSGVNSFNAVHVRALISNSHTKINKCSDVKLMFFTCSTAVQ